MDSLSDEIESVLYIAREVMGPSVHPVCALVLRPVELTCTVYQVPPRTAASGYKAADWNVEQFLWKGRLRVLEVGSRCELRLEVRALQLVCLDEPQRRS